MAGRTTRANLRRKRGGKRSAARSGELDIVSRCVADRPLIVRISATRKEKMMLINQPLIALRVAF